MGRPMRTTLGRWGRTPAGTPAAARHHKRGPTISFSTPSRGWGPVCPRPGKPVRFFLLGKSVTVSKKAEVEPAAGGANSAAGGLGGARRCAPRSVQGRPEGKRPRAARTASRPPADATPGRHVGTSARPSPLGRLRLGFTQARSHLCPRPRKTGQKQQQERGRLRRPPSSLPLASLRGLGPLRCLAAPPGLANGA